jgi:DNA (cytosine-5)-methyltransferase 1
MERKFRVVDLFAGPGGLAEGFSSVLDGEGKRVFEIALSVEKEASAHRTLTLRAFTRQFPPNQLPEAYYAFASGKITIDQLQERHSDEWAAALSEALLLELGTTNGNATVDMRLDQLLQQGSGDDIVVIGGPPCQAYSLVGRARNRGNADYVAEDDARHFLYREYIRILDRLSPAAFVMENVKGMLSSSIAGHRIFKQVRADLEAAGLRGGGYKLIALAPRQGDELALDDGFRDRDFLIRAEDHGVPQARHRVIIVGVRRDICDEYSPQQLSELTIRPGHTLTTVRDALAGLPALRSGLSKEDSKEAWHGAVLVAMKRVVNATTGDVRASARKALAQFESRNAIPERADSSPPSLPIPDPALDAFIHDDDLSSLSGHETRGHMASDLARYFFCSVFYSARGRAPKAEDFPEVLAPDHKNWASGKFADRFRVQGWDQPSTTIVSHIAKDGHYFIHPDATQCRSLTVREAARLQTFPDNYIFLGNRTEQFTQVGNAVPPYLAKQIGEALLNILGVTPGPHA